MELAEFSQADLLRSARFALNFWADRGPNGPYVVEMRTKIRNSVDPPYVVHADNPPRIEVWPPAVLVSGGLESYVKDQAAFWDVFNQLFRASTKIRERDR